MFNCGMEPKKDAIAADCKLIESLGGPAKVAKLLGYDSPGGIQRVHNWKARGIPASVKLEHPELFLRPKPRKPRAEPEAQAHSHAQ